VSDWIAVAERPPPYEVEVLVLDADSNVGHCVRSTTDKDGEHFESVCCRAEFENVTHWQVLPEKPAK
jgi:hypothetical protein